MQEDFHYYAVFQLAKLAGFSPGDSETIAYASQYVDDSTESEPIEPFPDQHFDTVRTAHYNLGAFGWNVQKKVYMPFHFLPTTIRWQSPKTFSYRTEPAREDDTSQLAAMLFDEALREADKNFRLIRMGVAVHTIADTFAHFGFSGRHHDENNVGKIWHTKSDGGWKLKPFDSFVTDVFVPRIGHVEASAYPDHPYLKWRYTDGNGRRKTRNNLAYTLKALQYLFKKLQTARFPESRASNLDQKHTADFNKMRSLFSLKGRLEKRIRRWRNYTHANTYKKTTWRKAALTGNVAWDDMSPSERKSHTKHLRGKAGFDTSKWAYFHRAALKQRSLVLGWIN